MPDRLVCHSSSIRTARDRLGPPRVDPVQPLLRPLLRGVIFMAALATPFVAALLAR
jgi:hypothetical protein